MPTFLVADVGSSFLKVGRFDRHDCNPLPMPLAVTTVDALDGSLAELAGQCDAPVWRVISVRRAGEARLERCVREQFPAVDYRVLTHRDMPLQIDVDHPDRVGVDRLAAAVAVNAIREPGRAAVVVDSGTAITVDLVNEAGAFQGGAILPGVRLASQMLHQQTDVLPEISLEPGFAPPPACGRNTRAALESGLFWGLVGAVKELVAQLSRQAQRPPHVFLSGGDGELIAGALGGQAKYVPHLALRGAALAGVRRSAAQVLLPEHCRRRSTP